MFVTNKNRNLRAAVLTTKSKNLDGTAICRSGQTAWSLLALAGAGTAIAIAISSGIWGKGIAFLNEGVKVRKIDDGGTNEDNDETDDGGTKEDRISELSDDLLSDILSRLSLVDAARTRILSRRWRTICAHRSRLIFDCLNMFFHYDEVFVKEKHRTTQKRVKHRFLRAVDQTLRLYSGHKMTSVKIRCCFGKECFSYFGQWIHSFADLAVEELSLQFWCPGIADDPDKKGWVDYLVFSFQLLFEVVSLKRLYLSQFVLQPSFNGQLNSLEVLCLCSIRLDREELPSIFSSCPNLLSLSISHCKLCPTLCISGPCGLEFLRIHECDGVRLIDIKVTNLITFDFVAYGHTRYKLSSVPKLEKLYVKVNGSGTVPYMFGEVAKVCPRLKSLTFQTSTNEVPYLPATMNLLSKLRQLDLLILVDSQVNLLNITPILDGCPLLEKLNLLTRCRIQSEQSGGIWPTQCHTHLKEVEFCGFHGTRNQIEFTLFLLKSAPALEQVLIQPLYRYYLGYGKWSKSFIYGFDNQRRELIYRQLLQQAVSPECIAKVLIC